MKRNKAQVKYRAYTSWKCMIARCDDLSNMSYGGAGVAVHPAWRSFDAFLLDMGERPSRHHTIDRIDSSKGYEPSNCRWATRKEQANNKSSNILLTVGGTSKTIAEWAESTGINYATIYARHKKGMSDGDCISPKSYQRDVVFVRGISLRDWAKVINVKFHTMYSRYRRGLPDHEILKEVQ